MLEPGQINIMIDMPADFMTACEMFGVAPQKALQYFLDQLSIYSHISKRCDNPKSVATAIFNNYLERRSYNPEPDYTKREINIQYMKKVIHLMHKRFSEEEKEISYKGIVTQWYEALQ